MRGGWLGWVRFLLEEIKRKTFQTRLISHPLWTNVSCDLSVLFIVFTPGKFPFSSSFHTFISFSHMKFFFSFSFHAFYFFSYLRKLFSFFFHSSDLYFFTPEKVSFSIFFIHKKWTCSLKDLCLVVLTPFARVQSLRVSRSISCSSRRLFERCFIFFYSRARRGVPMFHGLEFLPPPFVPSFFFLPSFHQHRIGSATLPGVDLWRHGSWGLKTLHFGSRSY